MARADRRRAQRPRPAAVTRRPDVVIEDTMFFPRLRRHAKWMFLFLALAFGLGFVGFGVGAGGIGIGDVFRGAGGASGVPSISDSEQRVLENPKDAQAFRDLATAHQAEGNTDEAIEALESFVALRPRNTDVLRELAVALPHEGLSGAGTRPDRRFSGCVPRPWNGHRRCDSASATSLSIPTRSRSAVSGLDLDKRAPRRTPRPRQASGAGGRRRTDASPRTAERPDAFSSSWRRRPRELVTRPRRSRPTRRS